jgi:hypothetical protein
VEATQQAFDLIRQAAVIGFGTLIVLARRKLLTTSLLLATGWKGGYFFCLT